MKLRALLAALAMAVVAGHARAADQPNFVIILADDLGYSDIGCYGGEIATPNLDALAAGGLRYRQFYNTARCWPTRAAILTGYYAQQVGRDALPGLGGGSQGKRPEWAKLLPEMLGPLGYRSYHSGKWHVDGGQLAGGFDRSYSADDHDRFFNPQRHTLDEQKLPPVELGSDYYATTAIADHAIACLREHREQHADRPFFSYVAFIAPHFPLHAPAEDIAKYRHRYTDGWDVVRAERWQRIQQELDLPGELSPLEPEVGPPYHFPDALEELGPAEVNRELPWSDLTPEQKEFQSVKMAIHAAMVDRMDQEIGRIVDELREMGELDNTVIMFLSDNGASAEIMVRGDRHDHDAPPGGAGTYLCLGPGWSSAANAPFRRHKTWVHEGGIATPLIVHWPNGIQDAGAVRNEVGHVIDVAPTLIDLADGKWSDVASEGAPTTPGRSLAGSFASNNAVERDFLWWLHDKHRALRQGDWKIVAAKDEPWELYNLAVDRSELNDLAADQPERLEAMAQFWEETTAGFAAKLNAE